MSGKFRRRHDSSGCRINDRMPSLLKFPTAKRRRRCSSSLFMMMYCTENFKITISIIIITISSVVAAAKHQNHHQYHHHHRTLQESNNFFCGTSWGDASENCNDRQHCPSGTDDECSTDGHICFGGTTCDSKVGHGNNFKYANVPYDDISNTRFCGGGWQKAIDNCSLETHCPGGFIEECPDGQSCYGGLPCNVKDIIEEQSPADEAEGGKAPGRLDKHSPKRNNFCGKSWSDANSKCGMWCPEGDDNDCPVANEGCFGSTECYYDGDLVPTATPVMSPTLAPSTIPPAMYKDPSNVRYCGLSWTLAEVNCSVETHCPGGTNDECPKGQSCHQGINKCNMVDLLSKEKNKGTPTPAPSPPPVSSDDPRNTRFCGLSWLLANENCSLETHCPHDKCPAGTTCYGGISVCNAAEMTISPSDDPTPQPSESPTLKPTSPTESPSFTPTTTTRAPVTLKPTISFPPTRAPMIPADDIRNSYYCGNDWADAVENCHEPCIGGQDTECEAGMSCIAFTPCRPKTPPPTNMPVTPEPSLPPVSSPPTITPRITPSPVTEAPSPKPVELTLPPITSPPTDNTEDVYTTASNPTDKPFEAVYIRTEQPKPPPPVTLLQQTNKPTSKPTPIPTKMPTNPPLSALPPSSAAMPVPSHETLAAIGSILAASSSGISNDVLYKINSMTKEQSPSQMYDYNGFINALGVVSKGSMGSSYFYLGYNPDQPDYGLANIALFLAQAAVESVQYDVCDDISWEKTVFGTYPIANSCGQGKHAGMSTTSYEDSNLCSEDETFMSCEVDPQMTAVANTHGIFSGAPPPLECYPSTTIQYTGAWNPALSCIENGCSSYPGQTMGSIDPDSMPTANSFGKSNVENCCWWGRGPLPRGTAGRCMIGKLNYYLGKRASDEGRAARYAEVDFCQDPSAICRGYYQDAEMNAEIRWLMGIIYWVNKVQAYNKNGWKYLVELHNFVDGGMADTGFIDNVSRIVTRGCHDQSCGNPVSPADRKERFDKIIDHFNRAQLGEAYVEEEQEEEEGEDEIVVLTENPTPSPSRRPTPYPIEQTNQPSLSPTVRPTPIKAEEEVETLAPVSLPVPDEVQTSPPVSFAKEGDYTLTPAELAQRLNFPNNYCATSSDEAKAKCATSLRTCNFGDPPCTFGFSCFGNIDCSIIWSDIGSIASADDKEEEDSSSEMVEPKETLPESDSYSGSVLCNGICLRPLSANECEAGIQMISSISNCFESSIGEMCENDGSECIGGEGPGEYFSSCPSDRHVFMRIFDEQCGTLVTQHTHAPSSESYHSSEPTSFAPPSPTPTLSVSSNTTRKDHNISNMTADDLVAEEDEDSWSDNNDFLDDRPHAWWTWEGNGSYCRIFSYFYVLMGFGISFELLH